MNEEEKERLIKKDIVSIENRVRHAFNQGYEMGLKERKSTCEDAISRQYLLDNCVVDKVTMPYVPISKIQEAPSVNLQPKTGHWIDYDMDEGFSQCECSECGTVEFIKSKYCPNCGTKMVEPQESEDEE